jgi:hypothetical protein
VQGIVISTGPNSKFGEVFKMMQAEEVSTIEIVKCLYTVYMFKLCEIENNSLSFFVKVSEDSPPKKYG